MPTMPPDSMDGIIQQSSTAHADARKGSLVPPHRSWICLTARMGSGDEDAVPLGHIRLNRQFVISTTATRSRNLRFRRKMLAVLQLTALDNVVGYRRDRIRLII